MISRSSTSKFLISVVTVLAVVFVPIINSPLTYADTAPPAGTPATVSADPLPTTQVNGIVWDQAIYGNKVYATGRFTEARPAGAAVGGAGTQTRVNLLAFDITTGQLDTSFIHTLTGGTTPEGRSIAVSPDGKRLYVGGDFSSADGQAHANFAAFDLTTNQVIPGFPGASGEVAAIAATNSQVFIGGAFLSAGGQSRSNVAAYNFDGTLNTGWIANVTGDHVAALVVAPTQGNLIIGGSFNKINGATYYSIGAVKIANGANVAWASQSSSYPMKMQAPADQSASSLGITSLSTDGTQVYLTAFTYIKNARPTTFEGRAAISPVNGNIIWINDCVGDSYDAFPIGQVLYSTNHSHNCSVIGGFPNQESWRALAETTYKTGTNVGTNGGNYPSFNGMPSSTLLNWFPTLNTGTVSGSYQAAWTVTGNSQYIALGGEFTKAQGAAQQGLVRYGTPATAPNRQGPMPYLGTYGVMANPASAAGDSLVRIFVTGDPDTSVLTYDVYRPGGTTPVATKTVDSRYWKSTNWTFTDKGVAAGTSLQYKLVVRDPFGNVLNINQATVVNDTDIRIKYTGSGWVNSQNRPDRQPDFARGIHYTTADGASYTYTFKGTYVKLMGEKATNRGDISVSIDGGAAVTVSTNSAATLFQQTLYERDGLTAGNHTVKVTKTSGTYMDVDAIFTR